MQKSYKSLLLTDEMTLAKEAREKGVYVVLCEPVLGLEEGETIDMNLFPYCLENASEVENAYLDKLICRFEQRPCEIFCLGNMLVREICLADVPALYEIYEDEAVAEMMEPLYASYEQELNYTKDYIKYQYGFYDFGMWVIEDFEKRKVIGRAGLDFLPAVPAEEGMYIMALSSNPKKMTELSLELGFCIHKDYRRRHIAYEVCKQILQYASQTLPQASIYARVKKENEASISLLTKLGFRHT